MHTCLLLEPFKMDETSADTVRIAPGTSHSHECVTNSHNPSWDLGLTLKAILRLHGLFSASVFFFFFFFFFFFLRLYI